MAVGGCLCALRALGWGKHVSVEYIYLYWIYSANIWGIYDNWRVSVRPLGAGLGKRSIGEHVSVEFHILVLDIFCQHLGDI